EALRKLKASRYDVVLSGEWLGDMSGADLVATLRKIGVKTPVLGVFADASPALIESATTGGIGTVIGKPYKIEQLAQLLLQYLSFDGGGAAGGAELSTKWVETGMRPMILSFLQGLEIRLADLEQQIAGGGMD